MTSEVSHETGDHSIQYVPKTFEQEHIEYYQRFKLAGLQYESCLSFMSLQHFLSVLLKNFHILVCIIHRVSDI